MLSPSALHCGPFGGVRSKNFSYDPLSELWRDFETESHSIDFVSDNYLRYKTIGNC